MTDKNLDPSSKVDAPKAQTAKRDKASPDHPDASPTRHAAPEPGATRQKPLSKTATHIESTGHEDPGAEIEALAASTRGTRRPDVK